MMGKWIVKAFCGLFVAHLSVMSFQKSALTVSVDVLQNLKTLTNLRVTEMKYS